MGVNFAEKCQFFFNNWQIIRKRVGKLQKLNICDGKLIKNEMLIKFKLLSF